MSINDRLTSGLVGPQVEAFGESLQRELDSLSAEVGALITGPDLTDDAAPAWALRILGHLLNLPRRTDWTDSDYLYALRLRSVSRLSSGTLPDLYAIVEAITGSTQGFVSAFPVYVIAILPGVASFSETRKQIVRDALWASIDAVADLTAVITPDINADKIFRLDDAERGLDKGLLGETL